MARDFEDAFLHSKKWKAARGAYISERLLIDGGLCEVCHREQGYIVHHKVKLTAENVNDPEIALNPENFAYECKRCHDAEEGHWLDAKGYVRPMATFDASGNPIDLRKI